MTAMEKQLNTYLDRLRALDFVQRVEHSSAAARDDRGIDGILRVATSKGTFTFSVELKSSYLDRAHINALITHAKHVAETQQRPLIVLARYLPAPSAERLVDAGVNFLDRAGNMHIRLGKNHGRTVIGRRESQTATEASVMTAAKGQLLFALAAYAEAKSWTVRQLADASGVSKSTVAKLRKQLVDEGVLTRSFRFRDVRETEARLLGAYVQAVRPKLVINRFRAAEPATDQLLPKLRDTFDRSSLKWSLTGGPAAFELQRFYKGTEIPIFVEPIPQAVLRELRILPDQSGPLIFLSAFGTVPFWRAINGNTVAHPWLIYSELMYSSDPRAHEAAEQIKAEFLKSDRAEQG